jgi:uncharacterized membrane protein YfcA
MSDLLLLLASGALAGTVAGLLGIGGGVIIVPTIALVFEHQGQDPAVIMHVAIGTSLATIVMTSLSSIRAHQRRGAILWPVFRTITPGILLGGLLGAVVADLIPGETLKIVFALFILVVAAQMASGLATRPHRTLPPPAGMLAVGSVIGGISALMGVGGGSMSVPFLTWCNVGVRNAVATSAAIGLPIALAGTAGFVISGWGAPGRPELSLGYVNLPAFLGIVVASTATAPLGAWLAHRVPELLLKRIFAVLLTVISLRLLFG